MNARKIVTLSLIGVFGLAAPALANQPPGPHIMLSEVMLLPVMVVFSLLGGAYAVLGSLYPKKRTAGRVVLAILAILFSGIHEGFGAMVAILFGILALRRGIRMLVWGFRALGSDEKPAHLENAASWRLIPAGALLLPVAVFLVGMAVVFVGYWPFESFREERLRNFLAYQLAYAKKAEEETGKRRFHRPSDEDYFPYKIYEENVELVYSPDHESLKIYMPPATSFPPFPYNYLTTQRSYYADDTGEIRMIEVHHENIRCPTDAPVVWVVSEADIRQKLEELRESEEETGTRKADE